MFNLQAKVAVITGGGSGIGQAIAELFAKQGAVVHILELNKSAAEGTVSGILAAKGKAVAHSCNVADQQQVKQIIDSIAKEAGRIDIVVNCAGIAHIGKLETTQEADFDKVYQVNVKGVYNVMF